MMYDIYGLYYFVTTLMPVKMMIWLIKLSLLKKRIQFKTAFMEEKKSQILACPSGPLGIVSYTSTDWWHL